MSTLHQCNNCGKDLAATQKRFCSPECLAKSMRKPARTCAFPGCSDPVSQPNKLKSLYCGMAHFNEHRILRARSTPEPPSVPEATWVPLTQGQWALVDNSDLVEVKKFNWCAVKVRPNKGGDVFYAKRTDEPIYLHRFLIDPPDNMEVDHIGSTLDCRRSMMRVVGRSQNQMNRYSNGGTSKYKGVYKIKDCDKWAVRIDAAGQIHSLGRFDSEDEAAQAYDKAARVYHGPQARLNFPGDGERSAIRSRG